MCVNINVILMKSNDIININDNIINNNESNEMIWK